MEDLLRAWHGPRPAGRWPIRQNPCAKGPRRFDKSGSMLLFAHEARVQMRGSQLLVLSLSVAIRPSFEGTNLTFQEGTLV